MLHLSYINLAAPQRGPGPLLDMSSARTGGASGASVVSQDCPKLRGKALRPAPRFRGDSAVLVSRAKWNLVNEGAVGTLIFFVDVAQGRSLGHIFGLWKAKLNTFPEK